MAVVSYDGFLGLVEREFPTLERAEQWTRQVGQMRCATIKHDGKTYRFFLGTLTEVK